MFTLSPEGADASTVSAAVAMPQTASASSESASAASGRSPLPPADDAYDSDRVRHLLFGSPHAVQSTIQLLHKLRYAEPNDWSRPLPTGRADEIMVILTKRVSAE